MRGVNTWIYISDYLGYIFVLSIIIVSLVHYFDKKNKEKDSE